MWQKDGNYHQNGQQSSHTKIMAGMVGNGESEGEVLLRDFILFLQTTPSASMLAEHFDVDGFIKAQAAEIVTGAADHYVRVGNNYYLYL